MPQPEEPLAIVELLGVRRGIPVITTRDLVDSEWLDLVRSEVSTRLGTSRVRWEESVATSVVTGEGLAELRDALRRVAGDLVERPADDLFRLPIDRVFAVAGAGTVVTGSTWSGSVAVGDAVQLLPLGREARGRAIEVHGQTAERAAPGRRTALALVGVDRSELARGHVAVTGSGWQATKLIDVAAELLPTARKPVASRTRVRVHLGTAEVLARAVQTPAIAPGGRGLARLVLETAVVARGGDRFVLRSFSPVTTIGGGVVLDPFAPPRTRLRRRRLAVEQGPAARLGVLAVEAGLMGLAIDSLAVRARGPASRAGARRSPPGPPTPAKSSRGASPMPAGRYPPWPSSSASFLASRCAHCCRTSPATAPPSRSTPSATRRRVPSPSSAPPSRQRSLSS